MYRAIEPVCQCLVVVRLTVTVRVRVPLVPVTVTAKVPTCAPCVVSCNVDDPEPVTEVGERVAVTPLGCPDTDKATAPVKPLLGVTVTVELVLPLFRGSCTVVGEALSEKVPVDGAVTVSDTVVVWLALDPVPVTVTG